MCSDKTKWIFDSDDNLDHDFESDFTESIQGDNIGKTDVTGATEAYSEDKTRLVPDDDKTQIFLAGQSGAQGAAILYDDLKDPVVGWLVVVRGPGLGQSVPIGVGMNILGRDSSSRIALPFGDKMISGTDHARIIYDDDTRSFFIAHGTGKSITKLNGQMVATTLQMNNYDIIELTKGTRLRFVAFSTTDFDWSDLAGKD
jgi:hypothetical protein